MWGGIECLHTSSTYIWKACLVIGGNIYECVRGRVCLGLKSHSGERDKDTAGNRNKLLFVSCNGVMYEAIYC